jgi:hypothetical protein
VTVAAVVPFVAQWKFTFHVPPGMKPSPIGPEANSASLPSDDRVNSVEGMRLKVGVIVNCPPPAETPVK